MKIGTLTIMLPTNYGNALQMLSLSRYLTEQGHDAEIINHWASPDRREISFWHGYFKESISHKIAFLFACLTWTGKSCAWRRESRIKDWVKENIKLSLAFGFNGIFPTDQLTYDAIIVGSDQIWHSLCTYRKFMMLSDIPPNITKIAYGASFDAEAFPQKDIASCKNKLDRFIGVSVRESSSVPLFQQKFGLTSKHVCDPTLFHTKEQWCQLLHIKESRPKKPSNMMYIVSPDGQKYYDDALRIARLTKRRLHVFAFACNEVSFQGKNAVKIIFDTLRKRIRLYLAGVRLHFAATPTEFVQQLADSECVFTDSFHGMIFSTIFEKRCNVVVGSHKERQGMKAKLLDFAKDYGDPRIITENFNIESAHRLSITPALNVLINDSKQWLAEMLHKQG